MPEVRVRGVRVRRLIVPLPRPLDTRVGRFTHGPFLALDLETETGANGRVLGFTFARLGLRVVPPVIAALAEFAKERPLTLETMPRFHDACQKHLTLLGHEGVTQMALSMFDMLVHDALAREAGIPLYRLLGGSAVQIPTYNSTGLGLLEPEQAAQEAVELRDQNGGYRHIKMRLGRETIADDIAAVRAVTDAVGSDIEVSADFNQGLEAQRAFAACRAIDGFGLSWIEEPVVYDDYPTQALIARKLATPLSIGENWWSWRVGKQAIDMGACDLIMPDILRIGGVTGWRRLAQVAEQAAMPMSSHLSPDFSIHVLAATPTRHWLEYMDWGQVVLADPLVPQGGFAVPRETPGTGIEWDEAAIGRCLVEP